MHMRTTLNIDDAFLGRATAALELSLAAESNTYLNQLLENFERLWREQHVPSPA